MGFSASPKIRVSTHAKDFGPTPILRKFCQGIEYHHLMAPMGVPGLFNGLLIYGLILLSLGGSLPHSPVILGVKVYIMEVSSC